MKKIIFSFTLISLLILSACGSSETDSQTGSDLSSESGSTESSSVSDIEGLGTEPFWAYRFQNGNITWQEPGENGINTNIFAASAVETGWVITLSGSGITIVSTPGTCSDGMSDNVYAFTTNVTLGTENFSGCSRWYTPGSVADSQEEITE